MKDIYFEMFGGATTDDRSPNRESDDRLPPLADQEERIVEQPKKSTGFFKAVKNMFKSNTKGESKADKKAETPNMKGSLFKSVVYGSGGVYEENSPDGRVEELSSPGTYEPHNLKSRVVRPDSLSMNRRFSPVGSPGAGGSNDYYRRGYSTQSGSTQGSLTDR